MKQHDVIYLDYAASSPLAPQVRDVMLRHMEATSPGNAHAKHHKFGMIAHETVSKAREQIAYTINANAADIVFTSGATESNNLALCGITAHLKSTGRTHIISSEVEHKSVLAPLEILKQQGFDITLLPPKPCGMVEADMVAKALTPHTGLVSIQSVNNETGTIQPVSEITAALKDKSILFHCDAAQALGKIPLDVKDIDLMTLSAHKACGPQGIGALYIHPGVRAHLKPIHYGSGHEGGLRSGTLPVALCAGFGMACTLIDVPSERARLQELRKMLLEKLSFLNPVIHGHAEPEWNVPGILNLRFAGIDSETLVAALPGLAFSSGASCSHATSHVIRAITGSEAQAGESIRLSFGGLTGMVELQNAADQIVSAVKDIRKMQEAA